MHLKPVFLSAFGLLTVLALLHKSASVNFWYWHYPWMDTGVHFLAGLGIGFALLWVIAERRGITHPGAPALYWTLVLGFGISVLWEVFEYYSGVPKATNYRFDTSLDLLMDVLGIIAANGIVRRLFS